MNIPELVEKHLAPWYNTPPSHIAGTTPTLREVCEAMVAEAIAEDESIWVPLPKVASDIRDYEERLAQAEKDRESWFNAYLKRGEELRAMTKARDDAVAAAKMLAQEFANYKAMMHDKGP